MNVRTDFTAASKSAPGNSDIDAQDEQCDMGALELRAFRAAWRHAATFRTGPSDEAQAPSPHSGGFAALRSRVLHDEYDASDEHPPNGARIAAALTLGRAFDRHPEACVELLEGEAPVMVDIPNRQMLDAVQRVWQSVLFHDAIRMLDLTQSGPGSSERLDGGFMVLVKPAKPAVRDALERVAMDMFGYALPFVAFSPDGRTHLPPALVAASKSRIELPSLDGATVSRTIHIVTGEKLSDALDATMLRNIGMSDLAAAVRFDRTPEECVAELRRLASLKDAQRPSRGLVLSDLHGMEEARAWADAAIAGLSAWRRGEATWDEAVSSAVMLAGPPGTGKTLFAEAFARGALGKDSNIGIPLIACSYYAWQSEGHLGDFMAAMRRDFAAARAQAPCVILLDECDSFVDRRSVKHGHSDYVRNCVNALLEELDGVRRREGVFVIGCTNDVEACDPALLRAGRFETVVRVGLPRPAELEKIFRVRLGGDLADHDICEIVELAVGMTGADAERVVKDAKRAARGESRALVLEDLRRALVGEERISDEVRWRTAVHEAGHVLVDVLRFGAKDVVANTTRGDRRLGLSMRTSRPFLAGTARDYRSRIEVLLGGRTAEELLLGEASDGAREDIAQATALTCAMLGSLGLAGPSPLTSLGDPRRASEFLRFPEIRTAAGIELGEAEIACRDLLEANRSALIAVAKRLLQSGRIDGIEVQRMLNDCPRESSEESNGLEQDSSSPSGKSGVVLHPQFGRE